MENSINIDNLLVEPNEEYDPDLNALIEEYNVNLSNYSRAISMTALIELLVAKNIITPEEWVDAFTKAFNTSQQTTDMMRIRDKLRQYIDVTTGKLDIDELDDDL